MGHKGWPNSTWGEKKKKNLVKILVNSFLLQVWTNPASQINNPVNWYLN